MSDSGEVSFLFFKKVDTLGGGAVKHKNLKNLETVTCTQSNMRNLVILQN